VRERAALRLAKNAGTSTSQVTDGQFEEVKNTLMMMKLWKLSVLFLCLVSKPLEFHYYNRY
jgi:hypothetical protein